MRIFFLNFLLVAFITGNTKAQERAERAPMNPDFIDYAHKHSKKSATDQDKPYSTGYYPSPVKFNFNQMQGQIDGRKKSTAEIPAYYDLRDFDQVTSVKDQNPLGSCWTFSSIGAIETRWIQLGGYTKDNVDLSEENMGTCHGFEFGINDGGNDLIAAAYLTRLDGPATEESDPYSGNPNAICPRTNVTPQYVPTVQWLPKDVDIVKKAIYNYGAVTSSIHVDQDAFGNLGSLNNADHTFYYDGESPVNHGVLIVGWDDNKLVTGGYASPGQTTGAWIVKNSWGGEWADQGYFYVSYEDTRFLSSVSMFPDRIEKSEVDTLYYYDKLGMTTSYGFRDETAYALVKYEADQKNFISKIGSFVNSTGTIVDIKIYDDFDGDTLTNLISESYGNFCKFPGYYTFDIPALVEGDYYIQVKYFTPGYGYPIPAEAEITFQGEDYALPSLRDSGFFWISNDADDWQGMGADIEGSEADPCIRVYADRNSELNAYFTANKTTTCVNSPVEFTHSSNGTINSYSWNFGEGAVPSSANTEGPHEVSYSSPGIKNIELTITGPSGTKVLKKNSYIEVVEELDIFLPYSEVELIDGKELPLTAFGADEYQWSPSTGLDTTAGPNVIASPTDTVTYSVSGTLGTCSGSAEITINIIENPDNDDVCEAFEIVPGGWYGMYTNENATVEDGEPAPPEGECDQPMEWCVEGGLHNSVWFKFTGPENGVISVDAPGMDNQLALWKIAECDSLFSESGRELIAAFDDMPGRDDYSAALENVEVIPGEQYFLQVDGSAGGAVGEFAIIFWDYPLSDAQYKSDIENFSNLEVFPNPSSGNFRLLIHENDLSETNISIHNASGKAIYMDKFTNIPGREYRIELEDQKPGIYFIRVKTGNDSYSRNIIIK